MAQEWIETALFIHGIMLDRDPGPHDSAYDGLFDLIQKALKKKGKPLLDPTPIKVEWGWNSGQSSESDRFLSDAERRIATRVDEIEQTVQDFSLLRPVHILARQMMIYGFGDLFYYVSQDGERAVRRQVFQTLCNQIMEKQSSYQTRLSLTIVAHSAGTIIAHDLLYHLFRKKSGRGDKPVQQVRELVQNGQFRVRKLYTMGSPITPMSIRSEALIKKLMNDQKLDPEDLGLRDGDGLPNPRWVNFWDRDDIAAFPVEFLYKNENQVIEDKYLDLGDVFPPCHSKYWKSAELARYIAETF